VNRFRRRSGRGGEGAHVRRRRDLVRVHRHGGDVPAGVAMLCRGGTAVMVAWCRSASR
jgi:hypothetical protein